MSDDLSGDMLAPSWPNLVQFVDLHYAFIFMYTQKNMRSQNSVGFPNNILFIDRLLKNQIFYVKLCLT